MDSPAHPDFRPSPKPGTPSPFATDDPLIQGNDIELAPTRRPFEERLTNPAPEAIAHSTLEVAAKPLPPPQPPHHHAFLLPVAPDYHHPPPPKYWESQSSRPNSPYYSHSASSAPGTTPVSVAPSLQQLHKPQQQRFSDTDFSSPFDQRPLVAPPPAGGGEGDGLNGERSRICGLRRQVFWAGLAVGVFLVVVAIAVGVGVGVGTSGGSESTASPTPSSTRILPLPTATASPSANLGCPGGNLTIFSGPRNSQKQYLLLCGLDYNSHLGATLDMYNTPTDSLSSCVELCAGQEGCIGAGWGRGATAEGRPVCWLKSALGTSNNAPGWSFFVEDSGN